MLKYGVVSTATLLDDLRTWRYLYLAGRLHKPVRWLAHDNLSPDRPLRAALDANERAACAASLVLLRGAHDEQVTLPALLATIVGLSYRGDVRVGIAEDAAKVQRIVQGSYQGLVAQYKPALGAMMMVHFVHAPSNTAMLEAEGVLQPVADATWRMRGAPQQWLPPTLQGLPPGALAAAIAARVGRSSRRQALLGLLSAGVARSLRYAGAKLSKAWRI